MRFDTEVIMRRTTAGTYNEDSGNYDPDQTSDKVVYADITTPGEETLRLLYGSLNQNALTVRVQGHPGRCDEMIIGGKPYRIDRRLVLPKKTVYTVSEVQ